MASLTWRHATQCVTLLCYRLYIIYVYIYAFFSHFEIFIWSETGMAIFHHDHNPFIDKCRARPLYACSILPIRLAFRQQLQLSNQDNQRQRHQQQLVVHRAQPHQYQHEAIGYLGGIVRLSSTMTNVSMVISMRICHGQRIRGAVNVSGHQYSDSGSYDTKVGDYSQYTIIYFKHLVSVFWYLHVSWSSRPSLNIEFRSSARIFYVGLVSLKSWEPVPFVIGLY